MLFETNLSEVKDLLPPDFYAELRDRKIRIFEQTDTDEAERHFQIFDLENIICTIVIIDCGKFLVERLNIKNVLAVLELAVSGAKSRRPRLAIDNAEKLKIIDLHLRGIGINQIAAQLHRSNRIVMRTIASYKTADPEPEPEAA